MLCPKCKLDRAHRSHRRGVVEHAASILAFCPYRCVTCNRRFLRFRYAGQSQPAGGSTATEAEIKATRAAFRWRRKRLELVLYAIAIVLFLVFLYFISGERPPSGGE
ncbi:MAG: hypothetical protein ABSH45_14035 [Bryobacteraceae bacterium]